MEKGYEGTRSHCSEIRCIGIVYLILGTQATHKIYDIYIIYFMNSLGTEDEYIYDIMTIP